MRVSPPFSRSAAALELVFCGERGIPPKEILCHIKRSFPHQTDMTATAVIANHESQMAAKTAIARRKTKKDQRSSIKSGTVIREMSVVVTTHREAKSASTPYFTDRSTDVLPAGIPVRIRDRPVSMEDIPRPFKAARATKGRAMSRIKAR